MQALQHASGQQPPPLLDVNAQQLAAPAGQFSAHPAAAAAVHSPAATQPVLAHKRSASQLLESSAKRHAAAVLTSAAPAAAAVASAAHAAAVVASAAPTAAVAASAAPAAAVLTSAAPAAAMVAATAPAAVAALKAASPAKLAASAASPDSPQAHVMDGAAPGHSPAQQAGINSDAAPAAPAAAAQAGFAAAAATAAGGDAIGPPIAAVPMAAALSALVSASQSLAAAGPYASLATLYSHIVQQPAGSLFICSAGHCIERLRTAASCCYGTQHEEANQQAAPVLQQLGQQVVTFPQQLRAGSVHVSAASHEQWKRDCGCCMQLLLLPHVQDLISAELRQQLVVLFAGLAGAPAAVQEQEPQPVAQPCEDVLQLAGEILCDAFGASKPFEAQAPPGADVQQAAAVDAGAIDAAVADADAGVAAVAAAAALGAEQQPSRQRHPSRGWAARGPAARGWAGRSSASRGTLQLQVAGRGGAQPRTYLGPWVYRMLALVGRTPEVLDTEDPAYKAAQSEPLPVAMPHTSAAAAAAGSQGEGYNSGGTSSGAARQDVAVSAGLLQVELPGLDGTQALPAGAADSAGEHSWPGGPSQAVQDSTASAAAANIPVRVLPHVTARRAAAVAEAAAAGAAAAAAHGASLSPMPPG